MKFRQLAVLAATALTLGLAGTGVAAAHGTGTHPEPAAPAAARAEEGLLKACSKAGFTALYTPIAAPFTAPTANDPATPYDDRLATAYTFGTREQCFAAVQAGKPVGLIARAPEGLVTVPAPASYPNLPAGAPVVQPATLTTEGFTDGAQNFTFTVRGVNFTPNAEVSALVTTKDGRTDFRVLGNTDAQGVFTYVLTGTCHATQAVTNVSALQAATGKAATTAAPAGLCV
jgi:hypothetical protein